MFVVSPQKLHSLMQTNSIFTWNTWQIAKALMFLSVNNPVNELDMEQSSFRICTVKWKCMLWWLL